MPVRITKKEQSNMSTPITNAVMTQDLKLSIRNAEGETLTVESNYSLLVTLSAEASKNFLSITASYADDTPITDVDVSWSSNCEEVASLDPTTGNATSKRIEFKAPGTATIQLMVRSGERGQQSASLTIVVAPGVLMFGPDGKYYHLDASVWQAHPVDEGMVPAPVTEMIRRGSVLFTSAYLLEGPAIEAITCYVINLASMSNHLVSGIAAAGSAIPAKDVHRSHSRDRPQAVAQPRTGASTVMRAQRMPRPVTKR
jgi:hypothetical protein